MTTVVEAIYTQGHLEPLEALDLGLYNWGRGERAYVGVPPGTEPDPDALAATRAALGL